MLLLSGGVLLFAAFIRPGASLSPDPPKGIPDSVWFVLETSCYECHSTDGNGMAKAKLNLDRWDESTPEKQRSKAEDICDVMQKGKMPPNKYRLNNPDAVPSPEGLARVCSWVTQLKK